MKNNRGISLIALIITILVMLVLVGAASYGVIDTIKKARLMEFTTEARNVEEIILREKALILSGKSERKGGKIISNMTVTDAITGETYEIVGNDNKFYYFESKDFETEFDVKISEGKTNRYYLVNYDEEPYVIALSEPIESL